MTRFDLAVDREFAIGNRTVPDVVIAFPGTISLGRENLDYAGRIVGNLCGDGQTQALLALVPGGDLAGLFQAQPIRFKKLGN